MWRHGKIPRFYFVGSYNNLYARFEKDQDYLAAITINGIWIKEKKNIIRAAKLDNDKFIEVSIYEFDEDGTYTFLYIYTHIQVH